ncbi:Uncharacterised protein [Mycobacteroides abscessus]|nr:Uncharacterised protein [Mycobacteroides abscessus]SHX54923.1 Uncharacterised protein [Mycobacteroides abscessus subsp. abscessus]
MDGPREGRIRGTLAGIEEGVIVREHSAGAVAEAGVGVLGGVDESGGDLVLHAAVADDVGDHLFHLIRDGPGLVLKIDDIRFRTVSVVDGMQLGLQFCDLGFDVGAQA